MTMTVGLLIFIAVFALAIGLFGIFVGSTGQDRRRRLSEHEAPHVARQPWDDADGRSNR